MSTSTATAYKYNVAGHLSFSAPKYEKAQKSSGFWANRTYGFCIKDNVLIDPAVGSGAFPLGMLNEIVKARETITSYMTIDMNGYQRLSYRSLRNSYRLKRETIKNSIFACDLEASATDITKLRLWLSLVIDNQIMDQQNEELGYSTKPRELPNLDCNIICGNSLVDSFKGISLITENSVLGNESVNRQGSMFDQDLGLLINDLIELQSKLYEEKDHVAKEALKERIQDIYNQVVLEQIQVNSTLVDEYYQALQSSSQPFILWQLYFPKVFRDNGGFDIVIGNPPYIQLQKTINESTGEKLGDSLSKLGYETFAKTGDIYCLFYEKGYKLLRKNGVLAFITSNKWMRAGYGEKLRGFFARNTNPVQLIDFCGQQLFESATVDVNILIYSKGTNIGKTVACTVRDDYKNNLSVYIERHCNEVSFSNSAAWVIYSPIEESIKNKINDIGTPLGEWNISINFGIKTGFNDAFIISTETRNKLIAEDPNSAELIRPILRGRDIQRYSYSFANLWLLNVHNGLKEKNVPPVNIDDYPAVKKHLDAYFPKLGKRSDKGVTPYNLRNCAYMNDLFKPKIIWGEISDKPKFAIDVNGDYTPEATTFMMTGEHLKYLLCFLNSTLSEYFFAKIGTTTGMGTLRWKKYLIETLPVPTASMNTIKEFENIIDAMLTDNNKDDYITCINKKIYEIFHFTDEEISFIEHMVQIGAH